MSCKACPAFTELFIKSSRWIHGGAPRCLARLFLYGGERGLLNLFLLDTLHRKLPTPVLPLYTYARLRVWNGYSRSLGEENFLIVVK